MMPVQMIRRNIQDGRHRRVEILRSFQLEAADFRHRHAVLACMQSFQRIRRADIPHHKNGGIIIAHNLSRKSRSRGLAIGPGNRYHLTPGKSIAQLYLTPNTHTLVPELLHKRRIHRNTRAEHQKLRLIRSLIRKLSRNNLRPHPLRQLLLHFPLIRTLIFIKKDRHRPHLRKQRRSSNPALPRPYYQNLFSFYIHLHSHPPAAADKVKISNPSQPHTPSS